MFGFVLKLFGQHSSPKTVTLKRAKNSAIVSSFDTIYFLTYKNEIFQTFTNVNLTESIVKLRNIPPGKYYITLVSEGMIVSPLDIAVCSKCKNEFEYYASIKPDAEKNPVYTRVTEMPRHEGGNHLLAKDFQNTLNQKEKEILNQTTNFSISFFVTNNKEVCDFVFAPGNLNKKIKVIIIKGISKITNWRISRQNGEPADEIFTIDKETLMKS